MGWNNIHDRLDAGFSWLGGDRRAFERYRRRSAEEDQNPHKPSLPPRHRTPDSSLPTTRTHPKQQPPLQATQLPIPTRQSRPRQGAIRRRPARSQRIRHAKLGLDPRQEQRAS
ncbi:hypothetical protein ACMFMG_008098 [Clarireedia jacksonii]